MRAKREVWKYSEQVKVWVGKYKNSHNLLHWHSDCELLYVERGCIDIFCEKKTHTLSAGELLFADSGQVHYMHARNPDTVLIVIIFDSELLRPYMGGWRLACPKLEGHYPIPQIYAQLRDLLQAKPPFFAAEAAGTVISLMSSVFRNEPHVKRAASDKTTERFMQLLDDISDQCEIYSFEVATSFMNMSEAYFSRYFKQTAGIPFYQYLNYVKSEKAIALLRQKKYTVTEIAEACGFGTIRNFNRVFKNLTGYTPSSLPDDFILHEDFVYPSDNAFNPTLHDCELIESGERT